MIKWCGNYGYRGLSVDKGKNKEVTVGATSLGLSRRRHVACNLEVSQLDGL